MTTTAATITDTQITALQAEAQAAGDWDQSTICAIALGETDPAPDMTSDEARAECARVIAEAEAQQ